MILTAVETEYENIRKVIIKYKIPKIEIYEEFESGCVYEHIVVEIESVKYSIILSTTQQGNSEAATHTMHAIMKYKPKLIIFAGTCGGIKDANIGDVVIATSVYDFTRGKEKETFSAKPVSRIISPDIRSISQQLMRRVNRGENLKEYFYDSKSKVIQGPVASSQAIIANKNATLRKIIDEKYADVVAVEMEGYGFYNAVYESNFENAILLRAVTDNAEEKTNEKDELLQPKVMEKMGYFVWEIIKDIIKKKNLQV